ncbi:MULTISPECIES: hypothetical protein [unclassified Mesorhizobium]|uniref:hypothetical protein n=1 Tax=unclassified Mesorhizobium TaxID=325217 RepID=UPI00112761A4|nr:MULTISPECIES: hypothetical protein [unclassified Mesorhizobium]TPK53806.1 hypothetical protein FJ550_09405 [Mesorhizobium sp. B2-5-2]TPL17185.1 hypothetical protein FJ946_28875 [Mesorhizobium sp. B2-4-7]TPL33404.1 hypothetical protein FJ961_28805 [Mesorhizobium sp. B2-4-5]TPM69156.1 hypothetical protein FJ968_28460 [Mesorhizobium sp. B2-1-6]TPN73641.1 hypothetical protein FJ985_25815 [Mesorhizobium sp. B1-1-2]
MFSVTDEEQVYVNAIISKEMPDIERVSRKIAGLLNTLSPQATVYAYTLLGAEVIASGIEDGDMAVELSKHLQRETEKALRWKPKYAEQKRVN